jgi:hypothetical protein
MDDEAKAELKAAIEAMDKRLGDYIAQAEQRANKNSLRVTALETNPVIAKLWATTVAVAAIGLAVVVKDEWARGFLFMLAGQVVGKEFFARTGDVQKTTAPP